MSRESARKELDLARRSLEQAQVTARAARGAYDAYIALHPKGTDTQEIANLLNEIDWASEELADAQTDYARAFRKYQGETR